MGLGLGLGLGFGFGFGLGLARYTGWSVSQLADLAAATVQVFCPKNQELAQLLLDRKLTPSVSAIPWLATALKRDLC